MSRRHKMAGGNSRKHFSQHASKTHVKNVRGTPMRGGIRL